MTDQELAAAIVNSLAWPVAAIVLVGLLRQELLGIFRRIQTLELSSGRATVRFATLPGYEMMIAAAAKATTSNLPDGETAFRQEAAEFRVVKAQVAETPREAVINAWGLLEYQLNVASDRLAPGQPHGWPQVAHSLEAMDNWPLLYPAVQELRRLRDYTVGSSRPPSSADAARYVSVAQDVAAAVRTASISQSIESPGGAK